MKKVLLAVSIAAMTFSGLASAKDWKEIRFGVDASYAPFEAKGPDGKLVGFDIDIGSELCKRLKAKCVWVENDFDGMIPALMAKKFDGILSSMSITEKRKEKIDFTNKIFNTPVRMIAKSGSKLMPTAASLKGKRVGVEQGTIQEDYAKQKWQAAGVEVVPYQNQDLVLADLVAGRIDAALQDAVMAEEGFLKKPQGKGFSFAGPAVEDEKIFGVGAGIGLRKEDKDLKDALNKAFAEMRKDGTYNKIQKKYFTFDVYGK
ncbi:ABC transporter substrate-binding protein [Leeia sp. TBRC 13508]|uniref:ABC transporter substrate-binding protein n=1 Tax=Leeia speluncae TaxID=2884804 RepID=A0ABS8DB47_9NEIS|nr:ABC transporter substrate-binding protein [Leeia speluncae]MCB6184833.1 ABC transporter substrate-binding protein [Leeia speluncae]